MERTPRRLIGTLISAAALLAVIPASAQALSFSSPTAAPSNLQAGAHSDFNIHIGFGSAGDNVKDLTVGLPPGEVGDPNATPFCSVPNLNSDTCPANTKVGTASSNVTILGILPQTVTGAVYNVAPHAGEPARFGIVLHALPITLPPPINSVILPPIILQSGVALRQTDFGLDTIVKNIPKTATVLPGVSVPVTITAMDLSLFGVAPGTGKPFLRNPTSCDPHHVTLTADSYSGATSTTPTTAQTPAFTPTGCGNLDFSPSFSAEVGGPGQTTSAGPTTASTSIDQDADEAGLLNAQVTVPGDFTPNLNLFGSACDPTAFKAGGCPAASVVGSAIATSPLLTQPLTGPVMLVQTDGPIPKIGLDLNGQLHLLLQGDLAITQVVTFAGLPDIPIAHFQLTFTPSPGLLMPSRDLCVPPAPIFHADFTGYNGATSSVDSAAKVDGCGAGAGATAGKCKKGKHKKHRKHRAAESKKKHKKHGCKKKKHKKHRK